MRRATGRDLDEATAIHRKLVPLLPWVGGPRLCLRHQGGLRDDGHANGPAPRPAPAAAGEGSPGAVSGAVAMGLLPAERIAAE